MLIKEIERIKHEINNRGNKKGSAHDQVNDDLISGIERNMTEKLNEIVLRL